MELFMSGKTKQRHCCRITGGFTLVELLVVIGIIALLISILLPALTRARRQAQRVACSAKLHQIMIAASLHANNHHGYYPLVGVLPGISPEEAISDPYAQNYSYLSYSGSSSGRQLAPITIALAGEMGYKGVFYATSNSAAVPDMMDGSSYSRNFRCPSQASSPIEVVNGAPAAYFLVYYSSSATETGSYSEPQSYIYNEAVLGYNDSLGRLRGQASRVHQPALTMFAADGIHGKFSSEVPGYGMCTLYNNRSLAPVTMGDAYVGNPRVADDPNCYDSIRHQGRLNVAFCDGHVETRTISYNDLNLIFLLPP